MGKLGQYEYPDASLNDSLAIGRRIAREFMGSVTRATLASALQMSDRGGGFGARLGAMRIWGIAEGRGTIRLSRNGLRAVNPLTPEETAMARHDLASSVSLFVELARRLEGIPPDRARLALLIEDITGAGRMDIERRLPVVARVFEEVLPLLSGSGSMSVGRRASISEDHARPPTGDNRSGRGFLDIPSLLDDASPQHTSSSSTTDQPVQPRIEVLFPDGRISLPESIASLDVIIQVLQERRGNLARGSRPTSF
ncbi:MAG: hypothetical protein O3C10_00405 [Chloroflexi bacterium]|nr:hypothetical protein [Chloroflexota bacterium]